MKKTILSCILAGIIQLSMAQPETAKRLVDEGVSLHDRGDYANAIAKYDQALQADPDNLGALSEKAYSLLAFGKPDETVKICKHALDKHKGHTGLSTVYVTYGNALDMLKQPKKSLAIYNRGIEAFPDFYLLHFNKGITLAGQEKYEDASVSFQTALKANPRHASSHNALARLSHGGNQKVPALLAYCRFLTLEQKGDRAKQNGANLLSLSTGGAKQTGDNAVTITLDPSTLNQAGKKSKKENDFSGAEFFLSMDAALDYDKANKNKTAPERFARKAESLFSMLGETAKDNRGFFWEYYVPYFVEMKEKKLIEPFSNIVLAATGDTTASEWLNKHADDVQKFNAWSNGYVWNP